MNMNEITKQTHAQVARAAQIGQAEYKAALKVHDARWKLRRALEELRAAAPPVLSATIRSVERDVLLAYAHRLLP